MTKLVIFDLDGTLLDTIHDLAASANLALARHGYPPHEISTYHYLIGNGLNSLFLRALPEAARTPANISAVKQEHLNHYNQHMDTLTRPFPGVANTLETLNRQGIAMAVVTNKPHQPAVSLMARFFPAIPFISVIGQTDGFPHKPDPAAVNRIIDEFGCGKDEVLYCGDSDVDMMTAKNARVTGVGVLWGYRPKEELQSAGADHLIARPEELLAILDH